MNICALSKSYHFMKREEGEKRDMGGERGRRGMTTFWHVTFVKCAACHVTGVSFGPNEIQLHHNACNLEATCK